MLEMTLQSRLQSEQKLFSCLVDGHHLAVPSQGRGSKIRVTL